jgi:hypothetical protein
MTYEELVADELRGSTQADYLVSIEGDLRIADSETWVFEEPSFPVVELARSLLRWLDDGSRTDFAFDSMSYEEVGAVVVRATDRGWVFSSVFEPGSASAPVDWTETERCVRTFIDQVESDLRGLGIDPRGVTRK